MHLFANVSSTPGVSLLRSAATAALVVAVTAALVVSVTATTADAASAAVIGPDVSSHQHDGGAVVNWNAAVRGGASFAFVKASEGRTYVNPYFAGDISALRRLGVVRGAYHFARPNGTTSAAIVADAAAEASFFVRVAGSLNTVGDLPAVLDLEQTGGLNPAQLSLWAHTWLAATKKLTGRTPFIYTYVSFWRSQMRNSTGFTAYPLWLASYGVPAPAKVGGWKDYTFWQYTSKARLAGVNRPVDMSVFNGSQAQLKALANYKPAVKPAPKPAAKPVVKPVPTPVLELAPGLNPLLRGSTPEILQPVPVPVAAPAKVGLWQGYAFGVTPFAPLLNPAEAGIFGKLAPRG